MYIPISYIVKFDCIFLKYFITCQLWYLAGCGINILKILSWQEKFKHNISIIFVRLVIGMMLFISVSLIVCKTASGNYASKKSIAFCIF